jgi:hypothetical protein
MSRTGWSWRETHDFDNILYKCLLYFLVLYQCITTPDHLFLCGSAGRSPAKVLLSSTFATWHFGDNEETAFVKENKWYLYFLERVSEVCVSWVFQWELLNLSSEPQLWNFNFSSCNLTRKSIAVYDVFLCFDTQHFSDCRIWGSHRGGYEDFYLLGYNAM